MEIGTRENNLEEVDIEPSNQLVLSSINEIFKFGEHEVKVFGSVETPWFRGKDVAKILGYKNITRDVNRHVDDDDKSALNQILMSISMGTETVPIENFNKKELSTIYINESGLYSLILRSKLDSAKLFKRWVTKDILPNIRKKGYYVPNNLNDEQVKQLTEQLQREKNLRIEAEAKNLKLITGIKEEKMLSINGYVYLATNEQYARANHFRFGRTESLESRINAYKTGRSKADKLYYVFVYQTEDVVFLEYIIRRLLKNFREDPAIDMYVIHWNIIHPLVKYVCEAFHRGIVPEMNKLIAENIDSIDREDKPIVPPKIKLPHDFSEQDNVDESNEENKNDKEENKNDKKEAKEEVMLTEEELAECKECPLHCFEEVEDDSSLICLRCPCHECEEEDETETLIKTETEIETKTKTTEMKIEKKKETKLEKKCKTCKMQVSLDLFEWFKKDIKYMGSCTPCRDKKNYKCKKCKVSKLGTEYSINRDKMRNKMCKSCYLESPVFNKVCKKCRVTKHIAEYDLNPKGVKYEYCSDCRSNCERITGIKRCDKCFEYKPSGMFETSSQSGEKIRYCNPCRLSYQNNKVRKCRECKESLPLTSFSKNLPIKGRNRTCDNCRLGIIKK